MIKGPYGKGSAFLNYPSIFVRTLGPSKIESAESQIQQKILTGNFLDLKGGRSMIK